MVEGWGETAFPVIFFDGERETNIGNVRIQPTEVYKMFQCMVAKAIGISPNQISIYLFDRRNPKSPGYRRKIPITGKTNFAQICQERDCGFLVVLKQSRSKKACRPKNGNFNGGFPALPPPFMPESLILLRRHQHPTVDFNYNWQFYDQSAPADFDSLNQRLQNVNNYSVAMAQQYLNPYPLSNPNPNHNLLDAFPKIENFCEECTTAMKNLKIPDFHHCVNDVVVEGFRPCAAGPIGPISR